MSTKNFDANLLQILTDDGVEPADALKAMKKDDGTWRDLAEMIEAGAENIETNCTGYGKAKSKALIRVMINKLASGSSAPAPADEKKPAATPTVPQFDMAGFGRELASGISGSVSEMIPPEQRKLRTLLQDLRDGERDSDVKSAARKKTNGLDCFVVTDRKLDVEATLESFEFMERTNGSAPGEVITMSLDTALDMLLSACPWCGPTVPLSPKGHTCANGHDFTDVGDDFRLAIRLGRIFTKPGATDVLLPDTRDAITVIEAAREGKRTGHLASSLQYVDHCRSANPTMLLKAQGDLYYQKPGGFKTSMGGGNNSVTSSGGRPAQTHKNLDTPAAPWASVGNPHNVG